MISKEEAEDFSLKPEEDTTSLRCVICGWPINRPVKVKKFYKHVVEWIERNSNGEEKEKIIHDLEFLSRVDSLAICRYDFFELIKNIIERTDVELGKRFEESVEKQYDFSGSLIS